MDIAPPENIKMPTGALAPKLRNTGLNDGNAIKKSNCITALTLIQQPQIPSQPNQHMCQPILNMIASATKSPLLNHSLKRTFGPAMRILCGDYTT